MCRRTYLMMKFFLRIFRVRHQHRPLASNRPEHGGRFLNRQDFQAWFTWDSFSTAIRESNLRCRGNFTRHPQLLQSRRKFLLMYSTIALILQLLISFFDISSGWRRFWQWSNRYKNRWKSGNPSCSPTQQRQASIHNHREISLPMVRHGHQDKGLTRPFSRQVRGASLEWHSGMATNQTFY